MSGSTTSSYLRVLTLAERKTGLVGAWLTAHRFQGVDLSDCLLEKACCDEATFEHVNLQRTSFRGAFLRRTRFVGCDLTGAVFPAALVAGAEFVACHGLAAETIRLLRERGATVQPAAAASLQIGASSRDSR